MSDELKKQVRNFMKKADIRFEQSENKEADLYIYGAIGGWFNDNTAQGIRRKLQNSSAEKIHVHINSGGGSAFDGVAIMNQLRNHKAEIIVHIDGLAASAASVIAMAGDKIIMPENTMLMIHRASTFGYGNATEFEKLAKDLKKIDKALAASYKKRFVGEESELEALLDDETWLTADEAVAFGFADEVTDEIEIEEPDSSNDEESADEQPYENTKEKLVAKYSKQNNQNKEPVHEPAEPEKQNLSKLFLNLGGK